MLKLEDIKTGLRVSGLDPNAPVEIRGVEASGSNALTLTYRTSDGSLRESVVYRHHEAELEIASATRRPFDADAADFRLAAEAQRIRLAGLHDPMLAVASSNVQPLPHQIRAVYGEMLPRTPLRFLLADDPGAGKTIMAGLLIKELLLREVVKRCLVVAPGGLVEQWQDELWFKFGLEFDLFTRTTAEDTIARSPFDAHPLLIARMDQLSRNEELLDQLGETEWDLVIVDEAHRMGASYTGGEVKTTKRFQLGELLSERTRHFLLMTATPHAGKEDDFQLFLSLLDRDMFAGKFRPGITVANTEDVMRRMVKEDLLTFEGKPLFPERIAETVEYELTDREQDLYEQVTEYVRHEMGRADNLDKKRRNTVGFALMVLQRRLASSPEAIYQSLKRRARRLEGRKDDLRRGVVTESAPEPTVPDEFDDEEYSADELESLEEELVDAATAARTIEELDAELSALSGLIATARDVRNDGKDRKWTELRAIVESNVLGADDHGRPRKLIIFTEHRDTLNYLQDQLVRLLGRSEAVRAIHGGVRRNDRRQITEEFTHNPDCQILLATDAAGEGLNLQVAHLMVNYDLPWNPNRIEQRFGRVHRIGQTEVCRLWNLVAKNTREGEVFVLLLHKIEEQRRAYGGRVFDVLGSAFHDEPLRELLVKAIRYGEQPEVRAHMEQVINDRVSEGLTELLDERALAHESLAPRDIAALRRQMEEARALRLQPHFIQEAFSASFKRLGGRIVRREAGRYEITNVPAVIRGSRRGPIATRYERVTFEIDRIQDDTGARAELVAPGHALHDATLDAVLAETAPLLERGTVMVSPAVREPELLVGLIEEVIDQAGESIAKRFNYAYVNERGEVRPAGPAPYLDCVVAPPGAPGPDDFPWLGTVELRARDWLIANELPEFLTTVQERRTVELERARKQVDQRMGQEINRIAGEAMKAQDKEARGVRVREGSASLNRKREEIERRLAERLERFEAQLRMSTVPPRLVCAALVLPRTSVEEDSPQTAPMHAVATEEVERRAVEAVMAAERKLGRSPVEMARNNKGFDIQSHAGDGPTVFLEVKGRIAGADDFYITHSEIRFAQNAAPHYRLAIVSVDPRGPEHDALRYIAQPFTGLEVGDFSIAGIRGVWQDMWNRGTEPY